MLDGTAALHQKSKNSRSILHSHSRKHAERLKLSNRAAAQQPGRISTLLATEAAKQGKPKKYADAAASSCTAGNWQAFMEIARNSVCIYIQTMSTRDASAADISAWRGVTCSYCGCSQRIAPPVHCAAESQPLPVSTECKEERSRSALRCIFFAIIQVASVSKAAARSEKVLARRPQDERQCNRSH